MDMHIPKKRVTIPARYIIRDPWMSKGLMTSSRTSTKLYHKCMNKLRTDPAYLNYIKYRNVYNTLKRKAKINYYSQLFKDYKFDIRIILNYLKIINLIFETHGRLLEH